MLLLTTNNTLDFIVISKVLSTQIGGQSGCNKRKKADFFPKITAMNSLIYNGGMNN